MRRRHVLGPFGGTVGVQCVHSFLKRYYAAKLNFRCEHASTRRLKKNRRIVHEDADESSALGGGVLMPVAGDAPSFSALPANESS